MTDDFINLICAGNRRAQEFIGLWGQYLRAVDNLIDGDAPWTAENVLNCFACGAAMYSHPFYQSNKASLQMVILVTTNTYADSVKWEKSPELWKRQWADVLRHADGNVMSAVTLICSGWPTLRSISAPFMAAAYIGHKDRHGVPE